MNKEREALRMALEALMEHGTAYLGHSNEYQQAIIKSKEALAQPDHIEDNLTMAQPEQKPVAWVKYARKKPGVQSLSWQKNPTAEEIAYGFVSDPLYRSPPKREWVGLTEMDIRNIFPYASYPLFLKTVSAIEAKLKELNHD